MYIIRHHARKHDPWPPACPVPSGVVTTRNLNTLSRKTLRQILLRVFRTRGPRRPRSICCLPIVSPHNKAYKLWATLMVAMDAVYTAFIVPIGVGFRLSDTNFSWGSITDFVAGACWKYRV